MIFIFAFIVVYFIACVQKHIVNYFYTIQVIILYMVFLLEKISLSMLNLTTHVMNTCILIYDQMMNALKQLVTHQHSVCKSSIERLALT